MEERFRRQSSPASWPNARLTGGRQKAASGFADPVVWGPESGGGRIPAQVEALTRESVSAAISYPLEVAPVIGEIPGRWISRRLAR